MKNAAVLLLPFALSGCIVASEKPDLDASLIVPTRTSSGPPSSAGAPPSAPTLELPVTCWPSPTSATQETPITPTPPPARAPNPKPAAHDAAGGIGAAAPPGAGADAPPAAPLSPTDLARNKCIYLIKSVIDESYLNYRLHIAEQVGLTNEGLDVGAAAASAATTATTGISNKVLSALTSTLTGSRAAFNNDALYQQSLQAIFKQMDAA